MVDFNNEVTVGTPAADVERISILQRRYDFIEAFEAYKKIQYNGAQSMLSTVRARMLSLFMELQACLKRRPKLKDGEGYDKIKETVLDKKATEEQILNVFFEINEVLDEMRLIRIDSNKVYDSSNVEEENKVKGY